MSTEAIGMSSLDNIFNFLFYLQLFISSELQKKLFIVTKFSV